MKKNLLLVLVFNSLLGFSQQAIRHRESDTVMKYLAIANGTNPSVITGPNNINHGQSTAVSSALVRTPGGVFLDAPQINSNIPPTIPNETIGATTLTFNNALQTIRQTSGEIQLTFIQKDARVNTNGDNFLDGHFTVWTLPTEQANGEPIPNDTRVRLDTPVLTNLATGGTIVPARADWLSWDSTQQKWVDIFFNPNGSIENNNFTWIDWVTYLNVNNFNNSSELKVYPNPSNNFLTIQNKENKSENFDYKIVDLTGRIVKSGNSKFNEQINIESLINGNYIIQIQTDRNQNFTQKLIKN